MDTCAITEVERVDDDHWVARAFTPDRRIFFAATTTSKIRAEMAAEAMAVSIRTLVNPLLARNPDGLWNPGADPEVEHR
jgi:hypothetical protein